MILSVMILFTIGFSSCSGSSGKSYKIFRVSHAVADFSFEYPISYPIPYVDREFVKLTSLSTQRNTFDLYTRSTISITVMESDYYTPDSVTQLEDHLGYIKHGLNDNSFMLLERSPVSVSGILGEQVSYTFNAWTGLVDSSGNDQKVPSVSYEAYFEKNGLLWNISINGNPNMTDDIKNDFLHIIQTFQFLD